MLLEEIKNLLILESKEVFSVSDFCSYSGFSKGYIRHLIYTCELPFYKPTGKTIFFKKEDVVAFMLRNRVSSNAETQAKVSSYFLNKKKQIV